MTMHVKNVSELYGTHPQSDIYVIGTGTSLRVFPKSFFEGKITVGLNMAWKMVPVNYGITIHPDLNIPEFLEKEDKHPEITWITGYRKCKNLLTPEQLDYAERTFYFFSYHGKPNTQPADQPSDSGKILDWVHKPSGNNLYIWSSVSQAGVNLAANLGARNIILVGCDNTSLLNNHHAHEQHTRWKGVTPALRYSQYYEGLVEVRAGLRRRGVNLINMNPFLSLDNPANDFKLLCKELNEPLKIFNADISEQGLGVINKKNRVFRNIFKKLLNWN